MSAEQPPSRSQREALVRAVELHRSGGCGAAMPSLNEVIQSQPWNVTARRLLGRCLLDARRWEEARPQFEAILELSPEDASALQGLREALAAGQEVEQARQVEQIESRRTRAEQLRAQYELRDAEAALAEGRLEQAEQALLAILAKRPEEQAAAARLAELYASTRRFADAAGQYERLAEAPGAPARYLLAAAQNREWAGDDEAAVSGYRRYLERERADASVKVALGRALARLGRCSEAVVELTAGGRGRTGPEGAALQLELARCYDRLRRPEQALAAYERAAQLDPRAREARQIAAQRRREAEAAPLRRAYAAMEAKDNEAAARELRAYLARRPDDAEVQLLLARTLSWSDRHAEAATEYLRYLEVRPSDRNVRRELARVLSWDGRAAAAAAQYQLLATSAPDAGAAVEDLEPLLQLRVQAGDLEAAEATARELLRARPGHPAATELLAEAAARRRTAAREEAQRLTGEGRYAEAAEAYRRYQAEYGAEPDLGLMVARLHSWGRDYPAAIQAYREYLAVQPEDAAARLELAAVLTWAQRPAEAKAEYEALVSANPDDVTALLGLAQIADQGGDDRVAVLRAYERVLARDATLPLALARAEELRREIAPRPRLRADDFRDSDDLSRLSSTVEMGFTLPGRISLTPFASYLRSEQRRLVPGDTPEIAALNAQILERNGLVQGGGGGLRVEARPGAWRLLAEAAVLAFDTDRTSVDARLDLSHDRGPAKPGLAFQYERREAVYDLNSGATLVAGIVGDTALASVWVPLGPRRKDGSPRLRAWLAAGASFYSESADGAFPATRQDRLSGRLSWELGGASSLAYVLRLSRFSQRSPLYFSPARDAVHLLSATLSAGGSRLRGTLVLEGGYETIDGDAVTPLLVQPALEWRIRPELPLRLAYRYGRSGASAFGASSYSSQGFELTISGALR